MAQKVNYNSPKGIVVLEGPVADKTIEGLTMNDKLSNFRPPEKQKKALAEISQLPKGMVYIARHENEIIGYITFHEPDEYTRWIKHPRVLEMGAIEVSEDWRRCRVAQNLLKFAFSNPELENYIVITMEFCWHWDVRETGLDIWDYQRMLSKLFGSVGLEKVPTDDPDILEHPANVLMARFGKNVSQEDRMLFEQMTFEGKLKFVVS